MSRRRRPRRAGDRRRPREPGSVPDPIDVVSTLEATTDADAATNIDDPGGKTEYTTTDAGTDYVDARAANRRAEDGDLAEFGEVDLT